MSSGFVSGGTTDAPIERSDEWLSAQKEIEEKRRLKAEQARQTDGKSLFETLQANKAAKQDAFEESIKLKNQFRALDEDEVEFLDSVLESTRAEEDRVKRETAEGLEVFRRRQDEQDKKLREVHGGDAVSPTDAIGEEEWTAAGGARKRKRKEKEGILQGVKIRRKSTVEEKPEKHSPGKSSDEKKAIPSKTLPASSGVEDGTQTPEPAQARPKVKDPLTTKTKPDTAPPATKPILGLVDYDSDTDG